MLGFEYGYSLDCPDGLVIWEAQFGDFCNAAQVVIDQFIVSAEEKWNRLSGIVLLLPHGFEGKRAGTFQRAARTVPLAGGEGQYSSREPDHAGAVFPCLRRQVLRVWRKPLVVMSPKSLLRHPKVVSTLDECAGGSFQRIIPDAGWLELEKVEPDHRSARARSTTNWIRSGAN